MKFCTFFYYKNYMLNICLYYKFFNLGKIYKINNKGHAIFVINLLIDLNNVIIIHFIKYLLLVHKKWVLYFLKLFWN